MSSQLVPLVIIAAGGHGRVLADIARSCGDAVAGFVEPGPGGHQQGSSVDGIPVLGDLSDPGLWLPDLGPARFSVALGSNRDRRAAYLRALDLGLEPATLVHPSVVVLGGAELGAGAQICAGAVIGVAAHVGRNVVINTLASIDHDTQVGDHAFVAPGAHLGGAVRIGEGAHVGIGAVVREGTSVGPWSFVAAGAVVVADVPADTRVAGVPARPMATPGR